MLQRMRKTTVRLWNDESGASLLEYSVLIGLIVAGVVASIVSVAAWTGGRWGNLFNTLNNTKLKLLQERLLCAGALVSALRKALMH